MLTAALAAVVLSQQPFPGELPGTPIGSLLPATFECSGAAWHPRLQQLFVVSDDGHVARIEASGALPLVWQYGSADLEGIAVANPDSDFVYLGIEQPDAIAEFRLATGTVTRVFLLTPWMQSADPNQGLEGLTFVPIAGHPEGGEFWASLQATGAIFRFSLPIASSATATAVTFLGSFAPVPGRTDLASLDYDRDRGVVLAAYDDLDIVSELSAAGLWLREWQLPGANQEGIAAHGCRLFVAEDQGNVVLRYDAFPAALDCPRLRADATHLSLAAGGTIGFQLRRQGVAAGSLYLLLGSASGTAPGLPFGPYLLPLNGDAYFGFAAAYSNSGGFVATQGTLPAAGKVSASLVAPAALPPGLAGLQLHHAWLAAHPASHAPLGTSNAEPLWLVP